MNLLHMKYAVEVARVGSLNKASESLFVALPNISRSIRELEGDLGITIFDRSSKGVTLTPEGAEFIGYAKDILRQIDHVEGFYKGNSLKKQRFSISAPRAGYIADAFVNFSQTLAGDSAEIFYKETNSKRTIEDVLNRDYRMGIIRYAENYDRYFKTFMEEKGLNYELVTEFSYSLVMSKHHPLASREEILFQDLKDYIEISHADPSETILPLSKTSKEERPDNIERRIFIFERASQFELLMKNRETFMWVSLTPQETLDRYDLVLKRCPENQRIYRDVLIYKKHYKLTELDKNFITALCEAKRKHLKPYVQQ